MGKRDYRHREPKKTKKEAKKLPSITTILTGPVNVEVVGKGKKKREAEEGKG